MTQDRVTRIHNTLAEALATEDIQIRDDSHRHVGHEGAQTGLGHFTLHIRSPFFDDTSPIERHRMIYDALGSMMQTDIHALSIRAYGADE